MDNYCEKIPLEEENIHKIIQSIENGEYLYYEHKKENPTLTDNGKGAEIWNQINTQIKDLLDVKDFLIEVVDRDIWKFILIFDKRTKYLYTLMRDNNFYKLKNNSSENIFHYMNLLSIINASLIGKFEIEIENEQITLFDKNNNCFDDQVGFAKETLNNIISEINEKIERYCLVLFKQKNHKIAQIEAKIPISGFDSVYTENWTKYINIEYNTDFETVQHIQVEEPDVVLDIRNNLDEINLEVNKEDKLTKDNKI